MLALCRKSWVDLTTPRHLTAPRRLLLEAEAPVTGSVSKLSAYEPNKEFSAKASHEKEHYGLKMYEKDSFEGFRALAS